MLFTLQRALLNTGGSNKKVDGRVYVLLESAHTQDMKLLIEDCAKMAPILIYV